MSEDRQRIEALRAIVEEHDLDALSVRVGENAYEIVRREPGATLPMLAAAPHAPELPAPPRPVAPRESAAPGAGYRKVTAPIVGVFYRASSPGAEPFIEVGSRVEAGQVVCILEAMKLMNEITTDHAGIVRRILPENGALVALGEEIVWIEP